MKKVIALLIVVLLLQGGKVYAQTEMMQAYDYEFDAAGDSFADNTRRIAAGETVFSFRSVFEKVLSLVRAQGTDTLSLLLKIVAVSILFAVLTNMQNSLEAPHIRDTVFFVCYIVICGFAADAFAAAAKSFESAVGAGVAFMNGCVPILTGLLLASGKTALASGINPVILAGCALLGNAVRLLIVPLLHSIAALGMVSNVSTNVSVGSLVAFLKKLVRWSLCFLLTAFSGLLAVQGFGSGALDAMTAKTARYVVSNGVPVVGGILSDTLETVVSSAQVIKGATGAAGVIALFSVCLSPIVQIAMTSLMFHLAAAVIEPVADKRIVSAVGTLSDVLSLMLGVLCAIFVMFVICVSMLMHIGG